MKAALWEASPSLFLGVYAERRTLLMDASLRFRVHRSPRVGGCLKMFGTDTHSSQSYSQTLEPLISVSVVATLFVGLPAEKKEFFKNKV